MQWNSGWPISLTTQTANSLGLNLFSSIAPVIEALLSSLLQYVGATDTDTQYIDGLNSLTTSDGPATYMGAVSPWFFTHYGADSYNKNVRHL